MRIVRVATDIHKHIGLQGTRPDIESQGGEEKMNIPQIAVLHIERQTQGVLLFGFRFIGFRRGTQVDAHEGIIDTQTMQGVPSFGDAQRRAGGLQQPQHHIHTHGRYQRTGVKSSLIQEQMLHFDRKGEEILGLMRGRGKGMHGSFEPQMSYVHQGILTSMTDKKAVYTYLQRQVSLPFPSSVEHHGRMMKRREIKAVQIDIHARLLSRYHDSFLDRYSAQGRHIEHAYYRNQ